MLKQTKHIEYKSKIVFLYASALNSTWVLFNSATDIWPGGLGSSSGELGHNLMDHHFRVDAQVDMQKAMMINIIMDAAKRILYSTFQKCWIREKRLYPWFWLPGCCKPSGLEPKCRRT